MPDRSDEQRARVIERQARNAYEQGRNEEAVERFRAAWEVYKSPWFMCERGRIEAEMDRARDAAQSLSACLRLLKPADKLAVGRKIERTLAEMRARVGALVVDANVPDAEVLVDGKVIGNLPMPDPIFVEPGSHRVEVTASGYASDMRVAVLHAGTSIHIPMRLEPMRVEVAPPLPERGPIEPKEGARSPIPAPLPVLPAPSAKAPVSIPMRDQVVEPARAPMRGAVILGGFGLGVVGAAVGAVGFMAAGAARSAADANAHPLHPTSDICAGGANDPCRKVYDTMTKAVTFTALGIAGLTVSAAGGGLVIYELTRAAPNGTTTNARVAVKIAPSEGALTLVGRF
jgi:hypothetical protein